MKTNRHFSIASAWLARGFCLGLVLLAAIWLASCDSRQTSAPSDGGDEGGNENLIATVDCPEIALSGFADPPVCTADAVASGGDVGCFQFCAAGTVHTVVETGDNLVYGYRQIPENEDDDPFTNIGILIRQDDDDDEPQGISLLVAQLDPETGPFALGRFSSWTGQSYRAIGQSDGEGNVQIDEFGEAGTGRIKGQFEAILCAYVPNVVLCEEGQLYVKGAFDITRTADVEGGSGAPF